MENQLKRWCEIGLKVQLWEQRWKGTRWEGVHSELKVQLQVRINSSGELSGCIFNAAALCFIMHAILNQTNRQSRWIQYSLGQILLEATERPQSGQQRHIKANKAGKRRTDRRAGKAWIQRAMGLVGVPFMLHCGTNDSVFKIFISIF